MRQVFTRLPDQGFDERQPGDNGKVSVNLIETRYHSSLIRTMTSRQVKADFEEIDATASLPRPACGERGQSIARRDDSVSSERALAGDKESASATWASDGGMCCRSRWRGLYSHWEVVRNWRREIPKHEIHIVIVLIRDCNARQSRVDDRQRLRQHIL